MLSIRYRKPSKWYHRWKGWYRRTSCSGPPSVSPSAHRPQPPWPLLQTENPRICKKQ